VRKTVVTIIILASIAVVAFAANPGEGDAVVIPAKISKVDMTGVIFGREDMLTTKHEDGNVTLDVTTLLSSDRKFGSGMYRSGKTRIEVTDPYGVDEFMYFTEGSVTLTSADGSVQTINAGEAATIPREWTGIWDTDGYTKIWVIYSEDGSGL